MMLFMKGTVLAALAVATTTNAARSGGKEAFYRAIDSVHASCDAHVSRLCTTDYIMSPPHMFLVGGGHFDNDGMDDVIRMIDTMLSFNPLETESSFERFVESVLGQIITPPLPQSNLQEQEPPSSPVILGGNGHTTLKPALALEYLAEVGNNMMNSESEDTPPNRRRLARRLTALSSKSADDMDVDNMDLKPQLGYGCYIDSLFVE